MTILWITWGISCALWLIVFFRLRFFERHIPSLDSTSELPEPRGGWPFISIIVPARNEEKIVGECLAALAAQDYPSFEIVFVNDQSTDHTLAMARAALEGFKSAKVIDGAPPPAGETWIGKSWALLQGVRQAKGDWLLFVDADVVHHPLTLRKAIAKATELGVDALSMFPTIHCRSFWEKMIMPLFATLSVLVEPLDGASHPEKRAARLCGAFILIKREAYNSAGTHAAVHDRILEDMALAQILKKQGRRIWLTYTRDLGRTRMYEHFQELWHGLSRLSLPLLRYSVPLLALAWIAAIVGTLVPWIAAAAGLLFLNWPLAGAGIALCVLTRRAIQPVFTVVRTQPGYAWLLPLAAVLYCLAATRAAVRHFTGRGLAWKGQAYGTS